MVFFLRKVGPPPPWKNSLDPRLLSITLSEKQPNPPRVLAGLLAVIGGLGFCDVLRRTSHLVVIRDLGPILTWRHILEDCISDYRT